MTPIPADPNPDAEGIAIPQLVDTALRQVAASSARVYGQTYMRRGDYGLADQSKSSTGTA